MPRKFIRDFIYILLDNSLINKIIIKFYKNYKFDQFSIDKFIQEIKDNKNNVLLLKNNDMKINNLFFSGFYINLFFLLLSLIPNILILIISSIFNDWGITNLIIAAVFVFWFIKFISSLLKICVLPINKNFYKKILILDILFLNFIDVIGIIKVLSKKYQLIFFTNNYKIDYINVKKLINYIFNISLLINLLNIIIITISFVLLRFIDNNNIFNYFIRLINFLFISKTIILIIRFIFILIIRFIFIIISKNLINKLIKINNINNFISLLRFNSLINIKLLSMILNMPITDLTTKDFLIKNMY